MNGLLLFLPNRDLLPDNLDLMIKMLARINRKNNQKIGGDIISERFQLLIYVLDLYRKIE